MASQQSSQSSTSANAVIYLYNIHPQLGNYQVLSMVTGFDRGDQLYASNLVDYHFDLRMGVMSIEVMVTMFMNGKQNFISISLFLVKRLDGYGGQVLMVISDNNPLSVSVSYNNLSISSTIKSGGIIILGGYIKYLDLNDQLVQLSCDFLASLHPNMINYQLVQGWYQVVGGVNVRLRFVGLDKYSQVVAVVGVDLKNVPTIVGFQVKCVDSKPYCDSKLVLDYFKAIQGLIVDHPQLLSYRTISLLTSSVTNDINGANMKIVILLQNKLKKLSVNAQLLVLSDKIWVRSYLLSPSK